MRAGNANGRPTRWGTAPTTDNPSLSLPTANGPGAPGGIQQALVEDYQAAALAGSSRRAYLGDVAAFLRWGGSLPVDAPTLARYIAAHAGIWAPATLERRLAGLAWAQRRAGSPTRGDLALVREVRRGIQRVHGRRSRQARPLLPEVLRSVVGDLDGVAGLRDRALLLVGFHGALRRSELVALELADLAWEARGVAVHLRRSKTDPTGRGRTVFLARGTAPLCPVEALASWLVAAGLHEGAVFRAVTAAGRVGKRRLGAQSVNLVIKRRAGTGYSAHSLRAGYVTACARAGVPYHQIQAQTGHRSLGVLLSYIREQGVRGAALEASNRLHVEPPSPCHVAGPVRQTITNRWE